MPPWPSRLLRALEEAWQHPRPARPSFLRTAAGVGLLFLGVVGLALPLIPGWPFLLAAAFVLGRNHPYLRPFVGWIERRLARRSDRQGKQRSAV